MASKLEYLQLEYTDGYSLSAAQNIYDSLDNLRTLALRSYDRADPMFIALLNPASGGPKDGVRLPRLETLIVVDGRRQIKQFVDVRDQRAAVGYPLKRLLYRSGNHTREVDDDMLKEEPLPRW